MCFKKGVSFTIAGTIVLIVAVNLSMYWHFRPQVSSFVFCGLMLWTLEWCFRDWHSCLDNKEATANVHRQLKWLWVMPLLLCCWANSHGGFVAGVCIYVAFLAGKSLEAWFAMDKRSHGFIRRFALMGFVGALSTLINPYGPDLHFWLLRSLGEARPEITDWHAVDLTSAHGSRFLIAVVLATASILAARGKRDWVKITILALVCWQAFSHVRHIAFFVLLFGFWIPEYAQAWFAKIKAGLPANEKQTTRPFSFPTQFCYGTVLWLLACVCVYRCTDIPVDKENYPVEAIEFMAEQDLSGNLVVTYNWAQYAIGSFGGEHKGLPVCPVAFDGRFRTCYPQEIVDMHFDFVIGDQGPGKETAESIRDRRTRLEF